MRAVLSLAFRLAVDSGLTRSNPLRLVARLDRGYKSAAGEDGPTH